MFKRIVVPSDGSSRAERALPVAARIASASGGSLLLVQVISPPIDYGGGLAPVPRRVKTDHDPIDSRFA